MHDNKNADRLNKRMGVFYTSPSVAHKLVCLTIDPILANMWRDLPVVLNSIQTRFSAISLLPPLSEQEMIYRPLVQCVRPLFMLRVCDPAMGNGIFLVETLRYMLQLYDRITLLLRPIPRPSSTLVFADYKGMFDIFFFTHSSEQLNLLWILFRGLWTGAEDDRQAWTTYVLTQMLYGVDIRKESRDFTIHSLLRAYHLWTDVSSVPNISSTEGESNVTRSDLLEFSEPDIIADNGTSVLLKDRLMVAKIHLHLIVANSLVSSFS
ncbi:MAG: SAM-dependent DNA methyltransferase, partial [Promethearchaeota archaeon]